MGAFFSLSGAIGAGQEQVQDALRAYCISRNGEFRAQDGTVDDDGILVLLSCLAGISVLYPHDFLDWDDASAFLSRQLDKPVFSFHIHDGDLWMFGLYVSGSAAAHFNPIPGYWNDNLSDDEREQWRGDANQLAKYIPDLQPESVDRYLVQWDLDDDKPGRAYPNDRFCYEDSWQLTDFMRKVGLDFPIDDSGGVIGDTFYFKPGQSK
jgi:hypothetical protein